MSNISQNTEREDDYDDDDLEYVLETSQGEPIKDAAAAASSSNTLSVDKEQDNSNSNPILMGTPTPNPSANSTGKNQVPVTSAPQVKHAAATVAAGSKSGNQQPRFTSQIRDNGTCEMQQQAKKSFPCKERGSVCKKKCSKWVCLVKVILIVVGLCYAYSEWTELKRQNSALSDKTKLQHLHLVERAQKIIDLEEQVERLKKKNAMLLQMADKVVEEEKRNCDFFDVFSIFTSTIGSKKERNLQELCLSYYRYSELESQVNNNPSNASNSKQQVLEPLIDDDNDGLSSQTAYSDLTATLNAHVETIQSVFTSLFNRIQETVQDVPLLFQNKEGDEQPTSEQPIGEEGERIQESL